MSENFHFLFNALKISMLQIFFFVWTHHYYKKMARSNKKRSPLKSPPKSPPRVDSSCETFLSQDHNIMIRRAIVSAGRHGINITAGSPVPASGNCAFESVLFNVNDRSCFERKLLCSPDYYRHNG